MYTESWREEKVTAAYISAVKSCDAHFSSLSQPIIGGSSISEVIRHSNLECESSVLVVGDSCVQTSYILAHCISSITMYPVINIVGNKSHFVRAPTNEDCTQYNDLLVSKGFSTGE